MKAFYLFLFLGGVALPARAIDLIPRYVSTSNDGVVIQRPYFADGNKKYAVKLDSESRLTESEGGALFTFDKFPSATMRLRQSPLRPEITFGLEYLEKYQEAARGFLPTGAQDVAFVEKTSNPLPINGWQSYRFTFSYRIANQARRQGITFLNLAPTEQIMIQTAANERDFDEITSRAFNIIRRWHEVLPAEETPFN